MNNFVRTQTEYQALLVAVKAKHGSKLRLPYLALDQEQPGFDMGETKFSTAECQLLLQRIPRDYNNPEGIQRAWKKDKIDGIKTASQEPRYTAPGSMIVTLNPKERPWVTVGPADGDGLGWIEIDLDDLKKRLTALAPDKDDLIDEEKFKIGYMIDAHHRTEGHYQGGRVGLEMAAVFYKDLPRKEMARVFVGVNQNQDKPSPTHTMAMRAMADMLVGHEKQANEIALEMNKDDKSILYQRVRDMDVKMLRGQSVPYVNLKTMTDLLTRHVMPAFPIDAKMFVKQAVIEAYFQGWSLAYPTAWSDQKKHVLVKAMGFTLMCRLFEQIYTIAQARFTTTNPNAQQFKTICDAYHDGKLQLDPNMFGGNTEMDLDWGSDFFGGYSSGKGINALYSTLKGHLTNRQAKLMMPTVA